MNTVPEISKPGHIAIIMDGNGRWAKQQGLPRVAGHRAGVKSLRKLIEHAVKIKLDAITVYAFSQENWQRPEKEVGLLMDLFLSALESEVNDLHKNNVRLKFIGDRTAFNSKLLKSINDSESLTSLNKGLCLNVAANYSGRWDVIQACQSFAQDILENKINPADINEQSFNNRLSLSEIVDPDLFIRTGGEQRISNYLLWQSAYSELYFTDVLWPDFSPEELDIAIEWFGKRQRRFGKTPEQVEKKRNA